MLQRRWAVAVTSLLTLILLVPRVWSDSAKDNSSTLIRVGLLRSFRNAKQVTLTPSSDYSIVKTGSSEKLASGTALGAVTVQIIGSQLSITPGTGATTTPGTSVTISPTDPAATINIDSPGLQSRQYRGKIELSVQSTSLLVVNELDLEDYLPGVLVGEMPSSFPEEALKSQAVAARCYTLCSRRKHDSAGFDVCDSIHCQVFDGCLQETPKILQAVVETKGQVLTYKGEVARVMYHGDCGGATQCYSDIYGKGGYPYLCGVTEPAGLPCSTWELSYRPADLAAKLVAAGIKDADGLEKITITKTSASGRALELGITGAKVSVTVTGSRLRTILGAATMKSTLFTVDADASSTITFKGKGHGHGIGLCQVGAEGLALPPFNYTYAQILSHYFPGTTLTPSTIAAEPVKQSAGIAPQASLSPVKTTKGPRPMPDVRLQEPKL